MSERWLPRRLAANEYFELHVVLGFGAAALSLWLFGAVLEEVLDDAAVVRWDVAAAAWVRAHTTPAGLHLLAVITSLGAPPVIAALAVIGGLVLWRRRRRTLLLCWTAAFAGGALFDVVVKWAVHRSRPVGADAYLHGVSFGFPSGHTMGATIGYGMVAYVLAQRHRRWRRRLYVAAALIALIVGASRVYLGVHYPTDVLGGLAAGAAWLAICLTGAHAAHRRNGEGDRSSDMQGGAP